VTGIWAAFWPAPSTAVASPTLRVGGASSSRIVTTACGSPRLAPTGLLRSTKKRSLGSSDRSPTIGTVIVRTPTRAGKLTVPLRLR
jgi:hypothetical protein